jgi:hypothetical protein
MPELLVLWRKQNPDKIMKPSMVESSSSSGGLGMGCYLTFSEASQGTLFINWKKEPLEGALAYFKPGKSIPGFKFKQNGGKSELKRQCGGLFKKNLHNGWCSFLKMCKETKGTFVLLDDTMVGLWFLKKDKAVMRLGKNQPRDLEDIASISASAPNHPDYGKATGALKLDGPMFIQSCGPDGFGMHL